MFYVDCFQHMMSNRHLQFWFFPSCGLQKWNVNKQRQVSVFVTNTSGKHFQNKIASFPRQWFYCSLLVTAGYCEYESKTSPFLETQIRTQYVRTQRSQRHNILLKHWQFFIRLSRKTHPALFTMSAVCYWPYREQIDDVTLRCSYNRYNTL